jgi:hypothetical protein
MCSCRVNLARQAGSGGEHAWWTVRTCSSVASRDSALVAFKSQNLPILWPASSGSNGGRFFGSCTVLQDSLANKLEKLQNP